MRIVFLDIDGVLNSSSYANKHYAETGKCLFMWDFVDPSAVKLLVRFLKRHDDIKLVISSSWRESTYEETVKFFREHELVAPLADYIVGVTPRLYNGVRGDEIDWFLDHIGTKEIEPLVKEPFSIDGYCIVDDEDDMLEYQMNRFVHVDGEFGLERSDLYKIIWILYRNEHI